MVKNINDILKFKKKIEVVISTNHLQATKTKLLEIAYLIDNIENPERNIILYALAKLPFVWTSFLGEFGEFRKINFFLKQLLEKDMIEYYSLSDIEKTYIDEIIQVRRGFHNISFYRLTKKGEEYLNLVELYENLFILCPKERIYSVEEEVNQQLEFFLTYK